MAEQKHARRMMAAVLGAAAFTFAAVPAVALPAVGVPAGPPTASASLVDVAGSASGQVSFRQEGALVRVRVRARGLSAGFHGFHVHTTGDCAVGSPAGPFTAAGGHLNAGGQGHGSSNPADPGGHDGDMPALFADATGAVDATFLTDNFTVAEIVDAAGDGSAVIIHASPDNFANIPARYTSGGVSGPDATTTSTGDSGARQRCGAVRAGAVSFGSGYWLVGRDGGIFSFNAPFRGSRGGQTSPAPVVGMAAAPSRDGYWVVDANGAVTPFNAPAYGSLSSATSHGGIPPSPGVVGMAATADAGASLVDSSGAAKGSVSFSQIDGGARLRVNVTATGLTPGWHGMHVHTKGDCTAGDPAAPFTAAGGHLNAGGQSHGIAGGDPTGHDGDLPLLYADATGTARAQVLTDDLTLGELLDADGSALIVHAGSDNYGNIPLRYSSGGTPGPDAITASTGDAGTRARCGLVQATGGYLLATGSGGVAAFGRAPTLAGAPGSNAPLVGIVASPSGRGAWLAAADGGVFAEGDAGFFGSAGGLRLNKPVVGMAATPSGLGYWLVAADGGIFAFGDAIFAGSTGGQALNRPVTGMLASAAGGGYHLVASDGGVFTFGDAEFAGSTGGQRLNMPIVGAALQS